MKNTRGIYTRSTLAAHVPKVKNMLYLLRAFPIPLTVCSVITTDSVTSSGAVIATSTVVDSPSLIVTSVVVNP